MRHVASTFGVPRFNAVPHRGCVGDGGEGMPCSVVDTEHLTDFATEGSGRYAAPNLGEAPQALHCRLALGVLTCGIAGARRI